MSDERLRQIAAAGLVIGAVLGMAGSFAPSDQLRSIAWAGALALISASPLMPTFIRGTGAVASVLLAVTAVRIFGGAGLTALSKPLPFYAYPFLALTLFGWAWVHGRSHPVSRTPGQ